MTMSTEFLFVIGAILAILCLIIGIDIRGRFQLRQRIRREWGQYPYHGRYDSEESLKAAWQNEKAFRSFQSEIDDLTWYDLDMWSVFLALNNTGSSVGSEALYQQLRNYDLTEQGALEELVRFFEANPKMREEIQYRFKQLGKQDSNQSKYYLAEGSKQRLGNFWLYILLGLLPLLSILVTIFVPTIGIAILVGSILLNSLVYWTQKFRLETELTVMRYLVQTLVLGQHLSKLATPLQEAIATKARPFKGIEKLAFSFRVKGNSEAEIFFEGLNMIFMLPLISYNFILDRISKHNQAAVDLWELMGRLEVAIAILNFRTYMPETCLPEFRDGQVSASDLYHPLLTDPVTNPVDWQRDTLVTGSNASGKSTYVKSIAIGCILAQTINTVPATAFRMQPGYVLSSMAVEDDLFEGDSYFVAEIKSIKRLLDQVGTGQRCYCFIDEILKGTNTIERIAASASVVSWLAQYPSLAFVATHDIELTEILKNTCDNLHFEESVTDENGITFDYLVKDGPATSRNAIALLKVMAYPESLVTDAQNEAAYFDRYRTWPEKG